MEKNKNMNWELKYFMKHMLNLPPLGLVAYNGAEHWAKKNKSYCKWLRQFYSQHEFREGKKGGGHKTKTKLARNRKR